MRLAFLVYDLHLRGGGERVTTNISNYFAECPGYRITIISIAKRSSSPIFQLHQNVEVKYIGIERAGQINKLLNRVGSVVKIRKFFQVHSGYDIILGIGTHPNVLLSFVGDLGSFVLIGCEHGSFNAVPFLWKILKRLRYHKLNALVSLTHRDLPHLIRLNPQSFVIPNSTPIKPMQPALLDNKIILAVGRLSYEKGYDYLIEVFSRFAKIRSDWNLRIVGDGPLANKLKRWIAERDLVKRIELAGSTDGILEEYMNASVYVLTSRNEGLPMAMIEAQTCGLPLVAFDIETGPSDIINDGKDGYLIACFNIDRMVHALLRLTDNADIRKEFGMNGFRNSQKFSEASVYKKWEDLFNHLQK